MYVVVAGVAVVKVVGPFNTEEEAISMAKSIHAMENLVCKVRLIQPH